MRAVIFNSGMGSCIGGLTRLQPKCMAAIYNTETIFARQVRILSACGVEEFVVTTGPFADQVEAAAAVCQSHNPLLRFVFVPNLQYRTTNYIVPMYLARAYLDTGVLLLHGDLVFSEGLVREMLFNPAKSLCLYHENKILPRKDFKAQFCDGILKKCPCGYLAQTVMPFSRCINSMLMLSGFGGIGLSSLWSREKTGICRGSAE